ncbi:alpha/beta hydrolase [Umezawaea endophytica]|uniref:Alpha/beta hydrolase n=1 Tax=Umezawaea endophytica TaxID=1654476 RepID=A0A9X2VW83_9PSEU|nr:alpha/beta hydrolase [Umezawaea endophytica]MCS7483174.1 alpha/beta hydrolase [Umezawaea endophytica]
MPAVVLVHGLYHQPAHFDALATILRAAGVQVAVPALHRGSLVADTRAVQAAVDALPTPPVALGHSYGGSVVTGLTGVAALVYVAAFVPAAGESAAGQGGATDLLRAAVRPAPDGTTSIDPQLATTLFYADCPPEVAARASAHLRPQAPGCGRGVPERQAWHHVPSTYLVCTNDRAVDPVVQRALAARCTTTLEWPTGHSPHLSRPLELAALVRRVRTTT